MTDPFAPTPTDDALLPSPPPPRAARKQSSALTWLLVIAALVAVGGIAFAGGRLTAPAANNGNGFPNGFPNATFQPGGGGLVNRGLGGTTLRGEVTAVSSDSITIKLANGSSVTVPLDAQTTYRQATSGSASDVTVGSQVAVEPGQVNIQPGASFAPGASPGNFTFGPATDVTVVSN